MNTIALLDCTLRDGGYVNDWEFGYSTIMSTYKRLDEAGCEYIEIGFIDDRREFDLNRSIVPNTAAFDKIFEGIVKKNAMPVAMIDYGTCSLNNIAKASESFIDGIRVIFKKEKISEAIPFCKAIKDKGYKLFIQAISITSYSDFELLEYINTINQVKPYAFSIVDTYGLLDNQELSHYFDIIDNNLDPDIHIGYHAHNNFQLAFSNSMKFLSLISKHNKIVDSTIYGMGKSAGNCASELIAMHMNRKYSTQYDLNQFLEAFDAELLSVYQRHYWGYKYNFYISALHDCHPNYVEYLLDKKTLTVTSVNEILSSIPKEKKLLFDKDYIKTSYLSYQSKRINDQHDVETLTSQMLGHNVVLLGPGKSLVDNADRIIQYINDNNSITITINFDIADFNADYIFISNIKRYIKLSDTIDASISHSKLIVTSNITPSTRSVDYILNYESLIEQNEYGDDNALILCLAALYRIGIKKVEIAGFDGFTQNQEDYYNSSYAFAGNRNYLVQSNEKTISSLRSMSKKLEICFLTQSLYQEALNDD